MIALVISIIVMLILAGVSINAVVGDNGIIGKAQDSVYLQSIAALQEYLQMKCSEYALEDNPYGTELGLLRAKNPGWFYTNAQGYILDSEGHVLYLIKKSGLPDDIRSQLKGGDASKVSQYYRQQDVYGVTSDLQVYYCKNGTDTIMGLTVDDLQKDNPLEIAYDENTLLAQVVNNGEAISTQALKSIKTLTIDTTQKLELLKTFKDLPSLQTVYFSNISIPNLNDIQFGSNITEVRFTSCAVQDYSALCGLTKLNKLYLITPSGKNTDVATLCSSDKGIASAEFTNLRYFGIVGNGSYIQSTSKSYSGTRFDITDVSGLANLSDTTKKSIQYMYLQNLQLTSIASLSDYTNVTILRCEENALATFDGIQNMSKLTYLIAPTCYSSVNSVYTMGSGETDTQNTNTDALSYIYKDESGKNSSLYYVDIRDARNLKWTSYLVSCSGIRYLYMDNNTTIKDVSTIASVIGNCGVNYTIPSKLTTGIISSNSQKLDLSNQTISKTDFEKLKPSSGNNTSLTHLNMDKTIILDAGVVMTDDAYTTMINDVLGKCISMSRLKLSGQTKLKNINFVSSMDSLKTLDLYNCNQVNDLSVLETNSNFVYASNTNFKLGSLVINNPNITLSNIQNTISQLGDVSLYWTSNGPRGFIVLNNSLLKKLEGLQNITKLCCVYSYGNPYRSWGSGCEIDVDLSGCLSLECIQLYGLNSSFVFPSKLKTYETYAAGMADFSNCTDLETINYTDTANLTKVAAEFSTLPSNLNFLKSISICGGSENRDNDLEFLSVLEHCANLETVTVTENGVGTSGRDMIINNPTGLRHLKYVRTININLYSSGTSQAGGHNISEITLPDLSDLENLTTLNLTGAKYVNIDNLSTCTYLTNLTMSNTQITSIDSISNLTNLETVNLSNNKIRDISPMKGLVNINSLNLSNNNINDIKPLENFKNLETLNLENNSLYDSSYDSLGKPYYTLTVFADLNQKQEGNLKNLYLSGNNIEDFSMLQDSNLKWDGKSGW